MRGRLPSPPIPRATRRGRRPRRPAEACADVPPRVTTRGDSRCRQHPRRGQDPSLRTEPLTPAYATPRAGHARPLPRGDPETTAHVNPTAFPYPPIRRAGCPHPAATSRCRSCLPPRGKVAPQGRMRGRLSPPPIPGQTAGAASPTPRGGLRCRQQQPLPSPLGEGGPAGPDEGQAPAAAHSRENRRGRRPLRRAEACADVLPRVTTRGDSRCRQRPAEGSRPLPTDRTIDGCPRNPRAGHARPLPRNNPTHLYTT